MMFVSLNNKHADYRNFWRASSSRSSFFIHILDLDCVRFCPGSVCCTCSSRPTLPLTPAGWCQWAPSQCVPSFITPSHPTAPFIHHWSPLCLCQFMICSSQKKQKRAKAGGWMFHASSASQGANLRDSVVSWMMEFPPLSSSCTRA